MEKILKERDELYYSDMAYALKKHAGVIKKKDIESIRERRILNRTCSETVIENGVRSERISSFLLELFSVVEGIYQKVGEPCQGFKGLSEYPDLVMESLRELEHNNSIVMVKNKK